MISPSVANLQILGISHLVLGVENTDQYDQFLERLGFRVHTQMVNNPNPSAKVNFVQGALDSQFSMKLVTHQNGCPPIELLQDQSGGLKSSRPKTSNFEILAASHEAQIEDFLKKKKPHWHNTGIVGLTLIDENKSPSRSYRLVVRCSDINANRKLWDLLGLHVTPMGNSLFKIKTPKIIGQPEFGIYVQENKGFDESGQLNYDGFSCISFFCKDSKKLREMLLASKFDVSPIFYIQPLNQELEVFLMRNNTNEIYEFVSVKRRP
jgi:hypothetical protein